MYVLSGYCQFSDEIKPYIGFFNKIIELQAKQLFIGIDASAKSSMWKSILLNRKGEWLENLIMQHDLIILNMVGQPSTFSNTWNVKH